MSLNGSSETVDAIRTDLNTLRSDFAALTKDLSELRKAGTREARREIESVVGEARERITHTAEELRDDAFQTLEATRKTFRRHPLACVAGAFGLGLIFSRIL